MRSNRSTEDRVMQVRTDLAWTQPFYGTLMMRLRTIIDPSGQVTTAAATNGRYVIFHPPFVAGLSGPELVGVFIHELLHVANGHHLRRGNRDPRLWNIAADLALNPLILTAGFRLPKDVLMETRFMGWDAEAIYDVLVAEATGLVMSAWGVVEDMPGEGGGIMSGGERLTAMADLRMAVADAANAAERAGKADDISRTLGIEARASHIDWREALRDFVTKNGPVVGSTWRRPSRRGIGVGLLLPSHVRHGCPPVGAIVDSSGSIDQTALGAFVGELRAINEEARPETLTVGIGGTKITSTFAMHNGEDVPAFKGGGGTRLQNMVDQFVEMHQDTAMLIVLTDLIDNPPWREPDVPVMWVVWGSGWRRRTRQHPTYGTIVPMDGVLI